MAAEGDRRVPYAGLPSYQQRVADFVDTHDLRTGAEARLLDLTAEVGELAKEALKATEYGRTPFIPGESWDDELADVFFALICLANSTAVDLDTGLDRALAKYARRLRERGEAGSGR
jgi:NTP pyrophosphatase (non-canonical NTP hydrolase)